MTTPSHGTITAYAKRRGITQQAASQFKAAGRLVLEEVDGRLLVNFAESDARMAATADPANVGRGENAHRGSTSAARGRPIEPIDAETLRVRAVFSDARARQMAVRAKQSELDYRMRCGELINAQEAKRVTFEAMRALRDALLRSPRRWAAVVLSGPGTSDPAAVERVLMAELEKVLDTFVCELPGARARENAAP